MAESVDAPDSKSGIRKDVRVRFSLWSLINLCKRQPEHDLDGAEVVS